MEIRLVSLELEAFKSFRKRVIFQFPQGDSVVMITGHWKGSTVSSGAGKTSLLEGLAWCFDISDSSMDSLKHWYGSKKPYAKTTLMAGPDKIEIIRDPKLSLVINGEPWNSMVKGAKEKLEEILGKNKDMVKAITYRKQRVRGKVVNSTNSELQEFLSNPLGLNEIETAADTFTTSSNLLIGQIDLLKRDVANYEMTLPMNMVSDDEMNAANEAFVASCKAYEESVAKFNATRDSKNVTDALWQEVTSCKAEITKIHALNTSIQGRVRDNASYKNSIIALQGELERLSKNTCYTCQREWDQSAALREAKSAEMDRLITALEINVEYITNSAPLTQALPMFEAKLQELNNKLGEASAPIQMAEASMRNAERSMYNAKTSLQTLVTKRENYVKLLDKYSKVKDDMAAKERQLAVDQGTAKLLGRTGFLGSIFDEILSDIEVRTNDMLSHFPNASHLTVQISSSKVVKTKGTTKKEISIGISRNGMDLSMDDISGGQQSGVELCSDLGAAEAIIARSGGALKWICLDEVLDGLGTTEKQAVVAMIKERFKGLVLMIEHSTEIKESFDNVIDIEYDGKESYVTAL